jgi:hypothetical protein
MKPFSSKQHWQQPVAATGSSGRTLVLCSRHIDPSVSGLTTEHQQKTYKSWRGTDDSSPAACSSASGHKFQTGKKDAGTLQAALGNGN